VAAEATTTMVMAMATSMVMAKAVSRPAKGHSTEKMEIQAPIAIPK